MLQFCFWLCDIIQDIPVCTLPMDNIVRGVDRKRTSNTETFTEFANAVLVTVRPCSCIYAYSVVREFLLKRSFHSIVIRSSAAPTGLVVLNTRSYWAGKFVLTDCMAIAT